MNPHNPTTLAAARVVLVHGAWHGAWCWREVVTGLAAAGVEALAVDLPGHGEDPGPATDLHGDAARVRAALDGVDAPVVLCGHSYGGAVVTEAGMHPAVAHLVYLCAFNVTEGESAAAAAADDAEAAALDHSGRPRLGDLLVRDGEGTTTVDPALAPGVFYNDCTPEVAAAAVARLGPQRMENLGQAPGAVAWRHRPSTYAVCTLDNAVHPGLQQILARRATHRVEWETGHSPFLSRPDLVVDLLAELARSL